MKKKKKNKNKNKSKKNPLPPPAAAPVPPPDLEAPEQAAHHQEPDIQNPVEPPSAPARSPRKTAPFPAALGQHFLNRLLQLEAAAGRLAEAAERRGDYKTALTAIQTSTRIITAAARLVSQHPHLADHWQPECLPPAEPAPAPAVAQPADRLDWGAVAKLPPAELYRWLMACCDEPLPGRSYKT